MVSINVFTVGGLRCSIYRNPDFTDYVSSQVTYSLDLTLNPTYNSYFSTEDKLYSFTCQGLIRTEYNGLYNFTVATNKNVNVFMEDVLMLDKPASIKEESSFQTEMFKNRLVLFEIRLWDDDVRPEYDSSRGYLQVYESSGNIEK